MIPDTDILPIVIASCGGLAALAGLLGADSPIASGLAAFAIGAAWYMAEGRR